MLAGIQDKTGPLGPSNFDVGQSMFEHLGQPPSGRLGPDEMAQAMERLQVDRKVELKEVIARTYDLGDEGQHEQYQLDMEHIYLGLQLKTHMLLQREPLQFVNDKDGPRYIAHMQWVEFRLLEEPVPTVGCGT